MSDLAEFLDEVLAPDGAPDEAEIDGYMAQVSSPDPDDIAQAEHAMPWRIDSLGAADWAARKIKAAREVIEAKRAQRDLIVAQADAWLAAETRPLERRAEFFEGKLGDWLRREIEADDSKKPKVSRKLPCGATVKRTPAGESLEVDDEEALVEWLAAQEGELVEFVPKYSKAEVKKLVTGDGLNVPGVHIEKGVHGWKVTL